MVPSGRSTGRAVLDAQCTGLAVNRCALAASKRGSRHPAASAGEGVLACVVAVSGKCVFGSCSFFGGGMSGSSKHSCAQLLPTGTGALCISGASLWEISAALFSQLRNAVHSEPAWLGTPPCTAAEGTTLVAPNTHALDPEPSTMGRSQATLAGGLACNTSPEIASRFT